MPPDRTLTRLLAAWRKDGDRAARDRVFAAIYDELRRIARRQLDREYGVRSLMSADLVADAYLRLVEQSQLEASDRAHFLAIAAVTMRRILVDAARQRNAAKRGGEWVRLVLDPERDGPTTELEIDVIAVQEALERLEAEDPELVQVIDLRWFAGSTIAETAEVMEISPATVVRHTTVALAYLRDHLRRPTA